MRFITWEIGAKNQWHNLHTISPSLIKADGVYVIWEETTRRQTAKVLYVGQGNIGERLSVHQNDGRFKVLPVMNEPINVTWAIVDEYEKGGIERYLANILKPIIGEIHPDAVPIPVNLPWG